MNNSVFCEKKNKKKQTIKTPNKLYNESELNDIDSVQTSRQSSNPLDVIIFSYILLIGIHFII